MRVLRFLRRSAEVSFPGVSRRRKVTIGSAVIVAVMAMAAVPALGILAGSPSNFESSDGNMTVGTVGNHDWANVAAIKTPDAAASNSDDSFSPGQKQDTTCPDISGHKNPNKDDFTDIARYTEVNGAGHTFLYGATIRVAANGSASENIELKHGGGGICPGTTDLLQRVAGDKLIAIDYSGGGASANFHVLTWVTSGACFVGNDPPPCWGATVQDLGASAAEGSANLTAITAANNPINGKALVAGQFAEFGIDLSAGADPIVPVGSCSPFAQTIWESRSSGSSFVSSTKDIVRDDVGFSNCGEIKIVKNTDPRNLDKQFSYTSNLPANAAAGGDCSGIAAGGGFCLNDKNATANAVDATNLPQGTYTVTEGADPVGFAFKSLSCTPSDHVTITGKQVSIALAPNDNITCTYVNERQTGAIKVTKTSVKTGAAPLAGAHFSVCTNNSDPCTPAKTGSGDLVTGSNGTACVDGLPFGTYYVTETAAPSGYARDDTTTSAIEVDNNATCADAQYGGEAKTYADTPLTDVLVKATSQDPGATASRITCVNASNADIGNSPQPAIGFADPVTVTANGLRPGTYTCTIEVDP
jgi:hypothetical protein